MTCGQKTYARTIDVVKHWPRVKKEYTTWTNYSAVTNEESEILINDLPLEMILKTGIQTDKFECYLFVC